MPLIVSYDDKFDILRVHTGEPSRVSYTIEETESLIIAFRNEDGSGGVVGFELWAASELFAPFLEKMVERSASK